MPTFVQLVVTGKIDSKKDTQNINEVLTKLQNKGATIKTVELTAKSSDTMWRNMGDFAVDLNTYDAAAPIEL